MVRKTSIIALTIMGLLISLCSSAQQKDRKILGKFTEQEVAASLIPRSKWKPFPQTTAEWQAALPDSMRLPMIKRGEALLGTTWPAISASLLLTSVRTGDRTEYSNYQSKKRANLMALILAETMEGKGRFLEDIMNGIWSTCEETYWGIPVHLYLQKKGLGLPDVEEPTVDLVSAETAVTLALADYFLGDGLDSKSKLLRPRIYHELYRRVLDPMLTARYAYLGLNKNNLVNNWNPWIISNWQLVNLLIEKDEARRAKTLHYSMQLIDHYFDSLGDDGGCDEGPSYWFVAGGSMFDALETLNSATAGKVNVYQDPLVRNMAAYIYKTHISGSYFINTADASPTIKVDAIFLFRIGKAINDPLLVQLAVSSFQATGKTFYSETNTRQRMLSNWLALPALKKEANSGTKIEAPVLPSVWISDIQLMSARTTDGLFVASHAGHNAESHNHNDVGDFIIYANGLPVIVDAGSGTYNAKTFSSERYNSWYNSSAYHNVPLINGLQQAAGRKFEAENVVYDHQDKSTTLKMDLEKAYPAETTLKKWTRTVKSDHQKMISITDEFEAAGNLSGLSQTFMTICDVNVDQPGRIIFTQPTGKKVLLTYDPKKWQVSSEQLPLDKPDDQVFKEKWQSKGMTRIVLTNKALSARDRFIYQITNIQP